MKYNSEWEFYRTDTDYSINYGNYTSNTFNIWELKGDSEAGTINENCFYLDIKVKNVINNSNYGSLIVDGREIGSGEIVSLKPLINHNFATYNGMINSNNLFRNWNYGNNNAGFLNPELIYINKEDSIIANFYKSFPLTVTNNLEGGSGGVIPLLGKRQIKRKR